MYNILYEKAVSSKKIKKEEESACIRVAGAAAIKTRRELNSASVH